MYLHILVRFLDFFFDELIFCLFFHWDCCILYNFNGFLHILDLNPLSILDIKNIFSHSDSYQFLSLGIFLLNIKFLFAYD